MKKRTANKASGTERGNTPAVYRCDRLPLHANPAKADAVRIMLDAWRGAAGTVAREQWRRFWGTGRFDAVADPATDNRKASAAVRAGLIRQVAERHGVALAPPAEDSRKRLPKACPGFVDPAAEMKASLGTRETQMVRRQVVGMLESFVSNRQNDFVRTVFASSLGDDRKDMPAKDDDAATLAIKEARLKARIRLRHMLFAVNKARAWFDLGREVRIALVEGGPRDIAVPPEVRRLARKLMSHVMRSHRKPSTRRIGMTVDQRVAKLEAASASRHFPLWLTLTVGRGRQVRLPMTTTPPFLARQGTRSLSFNVQSDMETRRLTVGVTTDIGEACERSRAAYTAKADGGTLRLDFGLRNLFVSDRGDTVGRNFYDRLAAMDRTITGIARHVQRSGKKPKDSNRYREHVARARGFVETELNRVLTALVGMRRPDTLVLERLDFQMPGLSARMNRILSNCGRGALRRKLKKFEEEMGLAATLEPCAWTSQTCSGCGYADRMNRTTQALFECLWCGKKMHADANAAANLGSERFRPPSGLAGRAARDAVLEALVTGHRERWPMERRKPLHGRQRERGAPPDPRLSNPYFTGERAEARSRVAQAA